MINAIEGNLTVLPQDRFCIVVSRFNEFISSKLLEGALDGLIRHGVEKSNIDVVYVPGAFEIPLAVLKAAQSSKYSAIITLGAVIKGATAHFDYVSAELSKGIAQISLNSETPVIFGVLTTNNIEQAIERAGTKSGNKGYDSALNAIEMANLMRKI